MLKENSREVEDSLWEFDGSNRKFSENSDINITPLPIFTRWRECQRCSHSTHFHFASPFLAPLHPVTPMVEFQFTQKRVLFSMQIKHNASTFNYFQFSQTYHMHAAHTHKQTHAAQTQPEKHKTVFHDDCYFCIYKCTPFGYLRVYYHRIVCVFIVFCCFIIASAFESTSAGTSNCFAQEARFFFCFISEKHRPNPLVKFTIKLIFMISQRFAQYSAQFFFFEAVSLEMQRDD